jgi:hypothetical protein
LEKDMPDVSEVEDWYERIDDIKALHSKFSSAKKVYNLGWPQFALRRRQNLYEEVKRLIIRNVCGIVSECTCFECTLSVMF